MNQSLVDRMQEYFAAGQAMDLDKLSGLYADEFTNLRMDREGRVVVITKSQFMAQFERMKAAGEDHGGPVDDVTYLQTSEYDNHGAVLIRRNEHDVPALYVFIWRMPDGVPGQLIREITVEDDLSGLLALMPTQ